MKNSDNIPRLPLAQLVAYMFDELRGNERQAIEDIIVNDDQYSLEISKLTNYCRTRKIFDSKSFFDHLLKIKDPIFQELIQKYEDISPSKTFSSPSLVEDSHSEKKPIKFNSSHWIIGSIILIFVTILYIYKCQKPEIENSTSSIDIPIISDDQQENIAPTNPKIEEESSSEKDKPFNSSIPKIEVEPPKIPAIDTTNKQIKTILTSNEIYDQRELDFPNIEEEIDSELDELMPDRKSRGAQKMNSVIDSLIIVYEQNNTLNEYSHLELGAYYLSEKQFSKAIDNFKKAGINNNIPYADWYLLQAYISQNTITSIQFAKQHFQYKYIKNINNVPPIIVMTKLNKMSLELREALSTN